MMKVHVYQGRGCDGVIACANLLDEENEIEFLTQAPRIHLIKNRRLRKEFLLFTPGLVWNHYLTKRNWQAILRNARRLAKRAGKTVQVIYECTGAEVASFSSAGLSTIPVIIPTH